MDKMSNMDKIGSMSTSYDSPAKPSSRVRELPVVTATELKSSTADVIDQVATRRAIAITRHDKPRAVLLSIEEYEALTKQDPEWLEGLKQEYQGLLDRMQGPEQRAAADRLFQATPEELGAAAVRAAQRKKESQP
jgi:prevent-host-death family protein